MPQEGQFMTRKAVTPDLEMSPNAEMAADFCVQAQPGLNDETTVSMMETQLWRDKKLPQFSDWLGVCSVTYGMCDQ